VALGYAAEYPDDVADLVLFDAPVLLDVEQRKRFPAAEAQAATAEQIAATITAVRKRVNETLDRDLASRIGGDTYEQRAIPAMRSVEHVVGEQDVPALLDRISVPVKFVYATDDPTVVPAYLEALASAYDNVSAVALTGEGNLPVTRPADSLAEITPDLPEATVNAAVKATKTNKWWIGGASAVQILQSADVSIMTRGIIMLIAGIALVALTGIPIHTFPSRLLAFAAAGYVLFESVQTIIGAVGLRSARKAWLSFGLIGLVGLVAGLFLLLNHQFSVGLILLVLAIRALFTGIFDLGLAWRVGGGPQARWLLALEGVLALAFAGVIFFAPNHGAHVLVYLLDGYLIVAGLSLVSYAWQSRRIARRAAKPELR
jgi:hypothetical protein